MSIRYKFILSLLIMTAVCLGIYIWIAKSVFEGDKELAVFEAASKTSSAQALAIKAHLDEAVNFASMLVPTLNPDLQSFSEMGSTLFAKKTDLICLGLFENGHFTTWQTKDPQITSERAQPLLAQVESFAVPFDQQGKILLVADLKTNSALTGKRLVVIVDLQEPLRNLKFTSEAGGSFLVLNGKPLSVQTDFPFEMAQSLLQTLPEEKNLGEQTAIQKFGEKSYLIASKQVQVGTFRILTVIPKSLAFIGLDLLYQKSMQFFGLIIFIVLFASVFMTRTLLKNLDRLKSATKEIAQGHFNLELGFQSRDEFGVLGSSFEKMSKEIQRLIVETKEKARMASELKTAQTVQENLFPPPSYQKGNLEVHGLYRPASECGGDWWYHFTHTTGTYVFICDATGHGAPAALITAAAKAAVNLMKREPELNLKKLSEAFNYALYETAKGNLLMTGFIIHIKPDDTIEYVNASHEPPMVFKDGEVDFLMDPIGPRFGQAPESKYETGTVTDLQGKFILMYTDGITGQLNKDGRDLGSRQFLRFLKKQDLMQVSLSQLNTDTFTLVDNHRSEVHQDDDLTIVSLRFQGSKAA